MFSTYKAVGGGKRSDDLSLTNLYLIYYSRLFFARHVKELKANL